MVKAAGRLCWSVWALLAAGSAGLAQQYSISTAAGGAPPATPSAATSSSLGQPARVALDPAGNAYFSSLNSVFKISPAGTLTLVAGNSHAGFSGDGGPAVNAQLNSPQGIAIDRNSNIYVADSGNNRVRMISPAGIISTFAGNGEPGSYGNIGDGAKAVQANLHLPSGVAVDNSGNVYIADTSNHVIRKVTPNGFIDSIAGNTFPGYFGDTLLAVYSELRRPQDVTLDSSGNIYIADTGNAVIRKITTDGIINTVAGNGSIGYAGDNLDATKAGLIAPFSVAVDPANNIYIAESADSRIRKVDGKTGIIITIAGNGQPGFSGDGQQSSGAQLAVPTGVAVNGAPDLYIADSLNLRIRKISGGVISTVAGNGVFSYSGDGGPAVKAQMNAPEGVAVDAQGNFYVADTGNNVVRKVAPNGTITAFAGNGTAGFGGDNGKATSAQLNAPAGLAVDKSGVVYIADSQNQRVRKVAADGTISTVAGNGTAGYGGDGGAATGAQLNVPYGVALDGNGNLYIAEFGGQRVRKVASGGTISTVAGSGVQGYSGDGQPGPSARLNGPQAVAVDNAGNLYIADTNNYAIRMVTPGGAISTFAGNGTPGFSGDQGPATQAQIGSPSGVAVDTAGNVFISDGSTRVRKVYPGGRITTIAGGNARGYSGDGGVATGARLDAPAALAVDPSGNVYVADSGNNAVRLLQVSYGAGMSIAAVTNGASNIIGPISPGEVITIYGAGLGPSQLATTQLDATGLVTKSLAGTSVIINGAAAPMVYAWNTQVAAVVPYGVTGSTAQVYVQYNGLTTPPVTVQVAPAGPAIFTLDGSGTGQAAAVNQDGSGAVNGAAHPVKVGDYVALYVTGYGQTNPPGVDGLPAAVPLPIPLLPVTVTIGGKTATTNFAGGAPGIVAGVMQVNAQVPAGVAAGNVDVTIKVGDFSTQSGVTIAVTN